MQLEQDKDFGGLQDKRLGMAFAPKARKFEVFLRDKHPSEHSQSAHLQLQVNGKNNSGLDARLPENEHLRMTFCSSTGRLCAIESIA